MACKWRRAVVFEFVFAKTNSSTTAHRKRKYHSVKNLAEWLYHERTENADLNNIFTFYGLFLIQFTLLQEFTLTKNVLNIYFFQCLLFDRQTSSSTVSISVIWQSADQCQCEICVCVCACVLNVLVKFCCQPCYSSPDHRDVHFICLFIIWALDNSCLCLVNWWALTLWRPQASHQPSEWCIRFAQMCRCVLTNRHKAVLLALSDSSICLTGKTRRLQID